MSDVDSDPCDDSDFVDEDHQNIGAIVSKIEQEEIVQGAYFIENKCEFCDIVCGCDEFLDYCAEYELDENMQNRVKTNLIRCAG